MKRQLPGRHLVQDHAKREKVTAGIKIPRANLFRGHVSDRTERGSRARQVVFTDLRRSSYRGRFRGAFAGHS